MTAKRGLVIGWCVVLFCVALFSYTRHNSFPVEFHADEAPKATQVLQNRPTYRQPLLLIATTELVSRFLNETRSVRQIVFTGRVVSAVFAAGAVTLISLLGYAVFGQSIAAAVAVGVAALSCPQLLLLAHYMKEDTALVFAGAAFVLALWYHERRPTKASSALVGTATALLASAKYIGLLAVPLAYWLTLVSGRKRAGAHRTFLIALIASWAVINYLVIVNPARFFSNLATEAAHPVAGHHGLADPVLLASPVWRMLLAQVNPAILAIAVTYMVACAVLWRRISQAMAVFLIGSLAYLILLSLSRFVLDRHLLPVTLAAYAMSGFGIAAIATLFRQALLRWTITAALLALVLVSSVTPAAAIYHELKNETRLQLRAWIRGNLPPAAVIAQDRPTHLNIADPEFLATYGQLPQRILTPRDLFVTDLGSVAELRAQGVTHVVTCDEAYSRLFTDRVISAGERDEYRIRRARYEEIFSSGKLLFEAKPQRPIGGSTSPVVRVYAISG